MYIAVSLLVDIAKALEARTASVKVFSEGLSCTIGFMAQTLKGR